MTSTRNVLASIALLVFGLACGDDSAEAPTFPNDAQAPRNPRAMDAGAPPDGDEMLAAPDDRPDGPEQEVASELDLQLALSSGKDGLGTQTGGTTDVGLPCGGAWTDTDEAPAHDGVYRAAMRLELWRMECEPACRASSCPASCLDDCRQATAPDGNVRNARLSISAAGPVQRPTDTNPDGSPRCPGLRRYEASWELTIDGSIAAQGTATIGFGWWYDFVLSGESGASAALQPTSFELDPSLVVPTAEELLALGGGSDVVLGEDGGIAGAGEMTVGGLLTFDGDEVLVELTWLCDDCADRSLWTDLARGVLRHEGAEPASTPVPASTDARRWLWPEAQCVGLDDLDAGTREGADAGR